MCMERQIDRRRDLNTDRYMDSQNLYIYVSEYLYIYLNMHMMCCTGWGMAFWLPLVLNGARAIALRERQSAELEKGVPCFPRDYPDTSAFHKYVLTNNT